MPKMKSSSCAKKRFRITRKGKVIKKKAGTRHKLEIKSPNRKLGLRRVGVLNKTDAKLIKKLLPYG